MQLSAFFRRAWPVFLLAMCALYFYGLNRVPFIGPDEPRYAEVGREMWLRGDPVSPTLGNHLWFEKPALLYWMMIASFRLFGVSEWAARFGPACSGIITVLAVLWIGSRVEDARGGSREETGGLGLCCGAALASSLGMMVFARGASFDVIVTMTITVALACFFVSETDVGKKERRWLLALFYVFTGASLLAKGLIGIVIPYTVVFVYFALRRAWPERQILLSFLWGTMLAVVVAALWYAPVTARHGWYFIDQFFIQHHFARFLSNKYHHPQPFYFYAPVLAALVVPWTLFLASALMAALRSNWRAPDAASKFRLFALAWLVVPVIFFSASNSKLPGYILPAVPGAALLIGKRLARYLRGGNSGSRDVGSVLLMRATGALLLLLAAASVIAVAQSEYLTRETALIVILPLIVAGVTALFWARRRELCAVLLVCAMFGTMALAIDYASEGMTRRESVRSLLERAAQEGYAAAPVFQLHTIERSAEFYAAGRLSYDANGEPTKFESVTQVLAAARQSGSTALVIVPLPYVSQLTTYAPLETRVIGDNGDLALVAARVR
ncbi:MAG: glycosyltransferase family 39 protein [Pyrinomonadaceae bacterium]